MKQFLFLSFLFLSFKGSSQNKSYNFDVEGTKGYLTSTDFSKQIKITFYGIAMIVKINTFLSVESSYQAWGKDWGVGISHMGVGGSDLVGQIDTKNNYHFYDLSLRANIHLKKHDFYLAAGPTYTYGYNTYITGVWQEPGYPDALIYTGDPIKEYYWGVSAFAGYNYSFFKNRVTAGIMARERYFSRTFKEYDLGLTLGYHFNPPKWHKNKTNKQANYPCFLVYLSSQ